MINKLSNKIAWFFFTNELIAEKEDIEVYAYGLEMLIPPIIEIGIVIAISLYIRQFLPTLAFLIAFIPIRTYAGGYHAKTHFRCFLVLLGVYCFVLAAVYMTPVWLLKWLMLFSIITSIATIYLLAPIENRNKPVSDELKKECRKNSLSIVIYQSVFIFALISETVQSSTLYSYCLGLLSAAISLIAVNIKYKVEGGKYNEERIG